MNRAILCITAFLLAACGGGLDQKLDGTSEAAYRASLEKIEIILEKDGSATIRLCGYWKMIH